MSKSLFIYDFRKENIEDEKKFEDLVENITEIPGVAEVGVYVTNAQKREIAGFSGNSTRYIDATDDPCRSDRDLLVYDASNISVKVISESDFSHFGVADTMRAYAKTCTHRQWKTIKEEGLIFVQECVDCKTIQIVR